MIGRYVAKISHTAEGYRLSWEQCRVRRPGNGITQGSLAGWPYSRADETSAQAYTMFLPPGKVT